MQPSIANCITEHCWNSAPSILFCVGRSSPRRSHRSQQRSHHSRLGQKAVLSSNCSRANCYCLRWFWNIHRKLQMSFRILSKLQLVGRLFSPRSGFFGKDICCGITKYILLPLLPFSVPAKPPFHIHPSFFRVVKARILLAILWATVTPIRSPVRFSSSGNWKPLLNISSSSESVIEANATIYPD